jgi:uncharacterized protein
MAEIEMTVEDKLKAMYNLQVVMSEIDKIRTLRGELPLEVQDLEDEIAGLTTRISKYDEDINGLEMSISAKKNEIEEAKMLIEKYTEQQNNVRNNREYDSLSKEIEFKGLEIELCDKKIREFNFEINTKKEALENARKELHERSEDLEAKKAELDDIIGETRTDEEGLRTKAQSIEESVEPRLLSAFKRIRRNARNGLAVVTVERDACGGCFNKIPPQRQLDIKLRKKVIVCEYCGRILVDNEMKEA